MGALFRRNLYNTYTSIVCWMKFINRERTAISLRFCLSPVHSACKIQKGFSRANFEKHIRSTRNTTHAKINAFAHFPIYTKKNNSRLHLGRSTPINVPMRIDPSIPKEQTDENRKPVFFHTISEDANIWYSSGANNVNRSFRALCIIEYSISARLSERVFSISRKHKDGQGSVFVTSTVTRVSGVGMGWLQTGSSGSPAVTCV